MTDTQFGFIIGVWSGMILASVLGAVGYMAGVL